MEQRVLDSFAQPVEPKKPSTNQKFKPINTKSVLAFGTGLLLLIGFLFLLRALFLTNPNLSTNIPKDTIEENSPLPITNFSVNPDNGKQLQFGNSINSPFVAPKDKIWLALTGDTNNYIGFLDNNIKFSAAFKLPSSTEDFRVYEDSSISYFINQNKSEPSKLYVQKFGQNASAVVTLELGENFTTHFYNPTEKLFYFGKVNSNGVFSLSYVDFGFNVRELYTSGFFGSGTKILNIESSGQSIKLKNDKICYDLPFATKTTKEIDCFEIYANTSKRNYWSNTLGYNTEVYSTGLRGEIYTKAETEKERSVLLTLNDKEISNFLNVFRGSLFLSTETLSQINAFFVPKPGVIAKFDLTSKTRKDLISVFPLDEIKFIFEIDSKVYVILNGTDKDSIQKYSPIYEQVPISLPVSSPSSGPVSAPVSYLTRAVKYWQNVELGFASLKRIIVLNGE